MKKVKKRKKKIKINKKTNMMLEIDYLLGTIPNALKIGISV